MRRSTLLCAMVMLVIACQVETSYAQPKPKSAATGRWISVAGTLGPVAVGLGLLQFNDPGTDLAASIVVGSGVIFGPGSGHLYAERVGRFIGGAAIRGGLVVTGTIATALIGVAIIGSSREVASGAGVVAVSCGVLYVADVVYDIWTVDRSVDRYNEKIKRTGLELVPRVFSQSRAVGAAVALSFR